ncbi:MAG: hypothetical protein F6K22_27280 [Okeania sp. SIO2F4]|uniref:hypothetical protein n=1 Tax=Okeania sp. SIO2F4 TaxID=2607790 RepID=UPI00142BA296|nr:hypothetical protein [Okeania sp. SIO2F4]NES06183.1 hypothetical protein [Okeania sp. SIO2F4]
MQSRSEVRHIQSPLEKSALEFPYIQFPHGFNLLVIIHYPLSINERDCCNGVDATSFNQTNS